MIARIAILLGALFGGGAVALGAYNAHGLPGRLAAQQLDAAEIEQRLDNANTAVRYLLTHALALVAVGAVAAHHASRVLAIVVGCFVAGVACFSGGLLLAIDAIAPAGGMLLIAGWAVLALYAAFFWSPKS